MELYLLILIVIAKSLFGGDTFWFSYKNIVSNNTIISNNFYISKAMTPKIGVYKKICIIKKTKDYNESEISYLQKNRDTLLKCFLKEKVYINSFGTTKSYTASTITSLKVEPINFTVNFNHGFGIISTFKNR